MIEVIFNQTRKFQTERRRRKVACVRTPAKVQKKVLIANIPDNKMEKGACARTLYKVQKMFQTQTYFEIPRLKAGLSTSRVGAWLIMNMFTIVTSTTWMSN